MTAAMQSGAPSAAQFRAAMSSFATGVTVVTTATSDIRYGMTVNSFASVSLDPLLVLVCLRTGSRGEGLIRRAGSFAVNVLSAGQRELSQWFASPHRPADSTMFDGVPVAVGTTGSPLLTEAAACLECRVDALHEAGDHVIVLGEVCALVHRVGAEPLVFHRGTYPALRTPRPGLRAAGTPLVSIAPHREAGQPWSRTQADTNPR